MKLPVPVILFGGISLLNEISAQMVAPLLPILLTAILGAGPVALGIVEGGADAVAAFMKLWIGRRADIAPQQRKWMALCGYALSNLSRPLMAFPLTWPIVALLRGLDRIGKGVRGAPRDAILADATPKELQGRAFGLQRAMDYAGAVGGTLIAAAILATSTLSIPQVILLTIIPGIVVVVLLALMPNPAQVGATKAQNVPVPALNWGTLDASLQQYLAVLAIFSLAKASETFLVLRGHELGMDAVQVLLLWAFLASVQTVIALIGAPLTDRISKRSLTLFNWVTLAISYAALSLVRTSAQLWLAVALYGALSGISEGVERSYVSELGRSLGKGMTFGWYYMITGVAAIPAGLLFGGLCHAGGPMLAFGTSAAIALICAVVLGLLKPNGISGGAA